MAANALGAAKVLGAPPGGGLNKLINFNETSVFSKHVSKWKGEWGMKSY